MCEVHVFVLARKLLLSDFYCESLAYARESCRTIDAEGVRKMVRREWFNGFAVLEDSAFHIEHDIRMCGAYADCVRRIFSGIALVPIGN